VAQTPAHQHQVVLYSGQAVTCWSLTCCCVMQKAAVPSKRLGKVKPLPTNVKLVVLVLVPICLCACCRWPHE